MKTIRYILLIFKNKILFSTLSLFVIGLLNGAFKYKMTNQDYLFYMAGGDSLSNSSLSLSLMVLTMTMVVHIIVGMILEYGLSESSLTVLPRIGSKSKYLSNLFITVIGISFILSLIVSVSSLPLALGFLKGNYTYNFLEVSISVAMFRILSVMILSTIVMVTVQYIGRVFFKVESMIYLVFAIYIMNYLGLVPTIFSNHLSHYAEIISVYDPIGLVNTLILKIAMILIMLSITLRKEIEIC